MNWRVKLAIWLLGEGVEGLKLEPGNCMLLFVDHQRVDILRLQEMQDRGAPIDICAVKTGQKSVRDCVFAVSLPGRIGLDSMSLGQAHGQPE